MNKRYGVVNVGSLKVKCLVGTFEGKDLSVLYRSNELTCLGCGMEENQGAILKEHLEETVEEVLRVKKVIERAGCVKTRAFATHALRDAANQESVRKTIRAETGFDPVIVEPEREGHLYFQAVMRGLPENQDYAVTDIGGGSVQVLIGNREGLAGNYSFPTGAQVLHEKFTTDPHSPESRTTREDLERMEKVLKKQYSSIESEAGLPLIYGSTNIIDLFGALDIPLKPYRSSSSHPVKTQPRYLADFIDHIVQFSYQSREQRYEFQKGYLWGVDKAFLNVVLLADQLGSRFVVPSNTNVLEGFLYEMAKGGTGSDS